MIARSAKLGAVLGLPLFMVTIASMAQADTWVPVDQGWTQSDLKEWYEMSAGSRLIPLSWLLALEQPDNDNKFLDDAHVAKFRYLPHVNSGGLPLPLGFTVDTQSDKNLKATKLRWKASQGDMEPWVGMNCAACHTAELTYKGNRIRVQGAPTLADFQSFMTALDRALIATRDDPVKWDRFATRVLAGGDTQADRARLKDALDQFTARRLRIEAANEAPLRNGYGRLDAFGHIFNDIALLRRCPESQTDSVRCTCELSISLECAAARQSPVGWHRSKQTAHPQWGKNRSRRPCPQLRPACLASSST